MNDVKRLPETPADSLTISRLSHGGYIVSNGYGNPGEFQCQMFAASEIEEALTWVKHAMTDCRYPPLES